MKLFRFIIPGALAVLVGGIALVGAPANGATTQAVSRTDQYCSAANSNPSNTWECPVDSSTGDKYYHAIPEQFETLYCGGPDGAKATISVQAVMQRTASGMQLKGLWIVYSSGTKDYASFEAWAIDGNGISQNGDWNYWGSFNPDGAARGSLTDVTRWPYLSPSNPVHLSWGTNQVVDLRIDLFGGTGAPTSCNARPMYIMFYPA